MAVYLPFMHNVIVFVATLYKCIGLGVTVHTKSMGMWPNAPSNLKGEGQCGYEGRYLYGSCI